MFFFLALPRAATAASEEELRAAYVFNFAALVEWPTNALPLAAQQLKLCYIGQDDAPTGRGVESLARLAGLKVNNREIVFKRIQTTRELKNCHIAVLGEIDHNATARLADVLRGASVVTIAMEGDAVSTSPEIAIRLAIENDRMVFDVNSGYAKRAGLTFSSKLLRLARKSA